MMNFSGYVLFCDYDGTLTNSKNKVLRETIEAIRTFTDHGGLFAMATGRGAENAENFPFVINGPSILRNGAEIYDTVNHRSIQRLLMNEQTPQMLRAIYERFSSAGITLSRCDGRAYAFRFNEEIWPAKTVLAFSDLKDIYEDEIYRNVEMIQACVTASYEVIAEIEEMLDQEFPSFEHSIAAPRFLNITAEHATKGRALSYLKEHFYPGQKVLAVGDGVNDLDMLENADIGFAMGNAFPAAKSVADIVLEDNDHSPVVQILDMIQKHRI